MKNGNEGMANLAEIENLNKQIYQLKKDIELVREDAQVEIMRRDQRISELEKINKEHQDLNGRLQLENTRLKGGM
jgi:division protein CdvB (Snf7/Vps24/ESCRT-III family)